MLSRQKERQNAVAVNPFLAMMYKNMSFNVWNEIYRKALQSQHILLGINLPKRTAHIQLGLEREISDEEEEEEVPQDPTEYFYQTEEDEVIDELNHEEY